MLTVTETQKKNLRKVRGLAGEIQDAARNLQVIGCYEQGAYIQFGQDISMYNVWEALLYAEQYETGNGWYRAGTTQKTLDGLLRDFPQLSEPK